MFSHRSFSITLYYLLIAVCQLLGAIMCHVMLQVETLDEATVSQKVRAYKTHETTMDFVLENFDNSNTNFKAMLDEA